MKIDGRICTMLDRGDRMMFNRWSNLRHYRHGPRWQGDTLRQGVPLPDREKTVALVVGAGPSLDLVPWEAIRGRRLVLVVCDTVTPQVRELAVRPAEGFPVLVPSMEPRPKAATHMPSPAEWAHWRVCKLQSHPDAVVPGRTLWLRDGAFDRLLGRECATFDCEEMGGNVGIAGAVVAAEIAATVFLVGMDLSYPGAGYCKALAKPYYLQDRDRSESAGEKTWVAPADPNGERPWVSPTFFGYLQDCARLLHDAPWPLQVFNCSWMGAAIHGTEFLPREEFGARLDAACRDAPSLGDTLRQGVPLPGDSITRGDDSIIGELQELIRALLGELDDSKSGCNQAHWFGEWANHQRTPLCNLVRAGVNVQMIGNALMQQAARCDGIPARRMRELWRLQRRAARGAAILSAAMAIAALRGDPMGLEEELERPGASS